MRRHPCSPRTTSTRSAWPRRAPCASASPRGAASRGSLAVPGDKSIAHRWLILAATALDSSRLLGVPASLDVRSTASCLAAPLTQGSTCTRGVVRERCRHRLMVTVPRGTPGPRRRRTRRLRSRVRGGRASSNRPSDLDCGNSGTAMRLLAGVAAAAPFRSVLTRRREPLGAARWSASPTRSGRWGPRSPPTERARADHRRRRRPDGDRRTPPRCPPPRSRARCCWPASRPRARPRSREPAPTRDHTEVALAALGAPIERDGTAVTIEPFQHQGFEGRVPGDPSSAAFLVAAAALTGSELTIDGRRVEPQPHPLPRRDGADGRADRVARRYATELGEPVGDLWVAPCDGDARDPRDRGRAAARDRRGARPRDDGHARGRRHVVPGRAGAHGEGVRPARRPRARDRRPRRSRKASRATTSSWPAEDWRGGTAHAHGDHRMAMAFVVAALAAGARSRSTTWSAADVSFPGFVPVARGPRGLDRGTGVTPARGSDRRRRRERQEHARARARPGARPPVREHRRDVPSPHRSRRSSAAYRSTTATPSRR